MTTDELICAIEREILEGVEKAAEACGRDPRQWVAETRAHWAMHGGPSLIEPSKVEESRAAHG